MGDGAAASTGADFKRTHYPVTALALPVRVANRR